MGLLDDAIREHLELKRRRGADPTEVARAEQEALGPVRREPAATPPQPDDLAETHHDEDHHDDEPGLAPPERLAQSGIAEEGAAVQEDEDPRAEPRDEPASRRDPDALVRESWESESDPPTRILERAKAAREAARAAEPPREPPERPQPREPREPRERHDPVDQPTTEHRVEEPEDDAPAPPRDRRKAESRPETPDEDVLEETPDFLQETPEHDRLWFEQRPPRDFDFDG
jgi:hypothetical protein